MTEILLYKTANQDIKLEVLIQNETIWLNQKQLCELFGRDKSVISRHIKNIYNEKELDELSTVAKNATVQKELAENEFEKYKRNQDTLYRSDFDNLILKLEKK
ncbi:MAG: hypothetical protein KAH72_00255 [Flavobacteriaceae bacterium]|nr:hypothetical protein [Flavobacteriaceae bacterium]